ncbi:hypothetical protein H4R34_005309 [Dimargaris verticillata]|uniref:RlpA-like protein double-psi beta-barrel domain-containing protein n=1 Tax=Dimargaris verticillata TaxID=2761393 RepID=A0A9W8EAD1_9FUNG|nr:hypothetical protein H4R34_005309 [Dimargaris verticillata]
MYKVLLAASLITILGARTPSLAAPIDQQLQPRAVSATVTISRGNHYQSLAKRSPGGSKEEFDDTKQESVVDEESDLNDKGKTKESKDELKEGKGGDESTSPKKCGSQNGDDTPGETGPTASASAEDPASTSTAVSNGQEYSGGTITHHNFSGENNACGGEYEDSDLVVALDTSQFADGAGGDLYDNNPNCGRTVEVSRGGKTVKVKVVDQCTTCGDAGLDLSPAAFQKLESDLDKGELQDYTWKFV